MILSTNYWKENISEMKKKDYNYLVLKVEHLDYSDDRKPFENGIQILSLCTSLRMANEFFKKMGMNKEFNFSILFEVQKAVLNDQAFSLEKLKEYFKLMKEVEDFARASQNLFPGADHLYVDSATEMILIGFSQKLQSELEQQNERKFGFLCDEFYSLSVEVLEGEKSVEAFSRESKKLCEDYLKAEKEANNQRAA